MSDCCNNTIIPINPCANSQPCKQIIDAACIQYNGTLSCGSFGANPHLNTVLSGFCTLISGLSVDQVFTKKVILTPAQLHSSNTSPITLIPTPGLGKFIQVLSVYSTFVHLAPIYNLNGNTNFIIGYGGGVWLSTPVTLVAASGDKETAFTFTGIQSASGIVNLPVIISTDTADLLSGGGTMTVYITYKIVTA